MDIIKEIRLAIRRPDPNRFQLRPLGLPSGVRLYAMTFRRSRMKMTVVGSERDQVFVAPDTPEYRIALDRIFRGDYQIEAEVTDLNGEKQVFESDWQTLAARQANVSFSLPLPVEKHGYYETEIRLMRGTPERKRLELVHKTTFAWLPKADRPYHSMKVNKKRSISCGTKR